MLAVGSLLAVAGAYAYLTQGQVRLTRLDQQLGNQLNRHRELELKVADLEQPSKVVSEAKQQGLVTPSKVTDLPPVSLPTAAAPTSGGR